MYKLETLLASHYLSQKQINKILNTDFVYEEDTKTLYFLLKIQTNNKLKNGEIQIKCYKYNLNKEISNHGSLENLFKSLVLSQMLLEGYILIPIEGGYICKGGEELYTIKDNTCTCRSYLSSNTSCKHIIFKEALDIYKYRIQQWKVENL